MWRRPCRSGFRNQARGHEGQVVHCYEMRRVDATEPISSITLTWCESNAA